MPECSAGHLCTQLSAQNKRYGMLAGFSLAQGCAISPLVAYASAVLPG